MGEAIIKIIMIAIIIIILVVSMAAAAEEGVMATHFGCRLTGEKYHFSTSMSHRHHRLHHPPLLLLQLLRLLLQDLPAQRR